MILCIGLFAVPMQIACSGGPTTPGSGGGTGGTTDTGACRFSVSDGLTRPTDATAKDLVIGVTAGVGCGWTATTQSDFFSIVSGATGSGNGQVTVRVAANSRGQRQATLIVAQITVTIVQDAAPCRFTLTGDVDRSFTAAGGAGTVNVGVTQGANCQWAATTDAGFVTIAPPGTGTGDGSFSFAVAASTDSARTATIAVGGQQVTIRQAGGPHLDTNTSLIFFGGEAVITGTGFTPNSNATVCFSSSAVPSVICSPRGANSIRADGTFTTRYQSGISPNRVDFYAIDDATGLSSNHLTLTTP